METTMTLKERAEKAIDDIRGYLETDGGNAHVLDVTDEGVAHIELLGTCKTCPMSAQTMKNGIEEAIKSSVPEIIRVEAIDP